MHTESSTTLSQPCSVDPYVIDFWAETGTWHVCLILSFAQLCSTNRFQPSHMEYDFLGLVIIPSFWSVQFTYFGNVQTIEKLYFQELSVNDLMTRMEKVPL